MNLRLHEAEVLILIKDIEQKEVREKWQLH